MELASMWELLSIVVCIAVLVLCIRVVNDAFLPEE